jgi:hypothetical protein
LHKNTLLHLGRKGHTPFSAERHHLLLLISILFFLFLAKIVKKPPPQKGLSLSAGTTKNWLPLCANFFSNHFFLIESFVFYMCWLTFYLDPMLQLPNLQRQHCSRLECFNLGKKLVLL